MDLFPSPEQALLAETAASLAARVGDPARVRELGATTDGFDPATWATMAELGWTELPPLELAFVVEQLGRVALPTPLPLTGALRSALPAHAATTAPDAVWTIGSLVPGASDESAGPHPAIADDGTVTATFLLVPFASRADVVVVATASGLAAVAGDAFGITRRRHSAVGGDAVFRVDLDATAVTPVAGTLAAAIDHLAVLALASAVGAAEGALALSVRHAQDRHQFGRPIGSFQAVAHRCADMRAEIDACRYLAYRAAWALGGRGDARTAIAAALAYAKDALRRVAMHAHQVHGAIGFSTEHDLHLFTRRIKAFELTGGSTAQHQERLASAIGLRW